MAPRKAAAAPVEIARLEEAVTLSRGGKFAATLLVLHNLLMPVVVYLATANSAAVGTAWIAGNVLLGACMFMGRRSSYRVTREADPPP